MEPVAAGNTLEATVTRLENYGAWIESGGRVGLILIPEISWSRIRHPSEALSVGQQVTVKILNVAKDGKFSASLREMHPELNPWRDPTVFAVGNEFTGPVVMVLEYGCFVELQPEVWGLLKREPWRRPLAVGNRVCVRVESLNADQQKIEVREIA
jgi:small subunit ribosomal protein S1